jgi:c-di-GMP-binding flagellar brake protein YcgR
MMETSSKEKRSEIRVPLLSEKISYFVDGREFTADIADITTDGIFLRSNEVLKPRTFVKVQLTLPGDLGVLEVAGHVVRVNWSLSKKHKKDHLGMGIRFENLSENIKKILDAYVVYLRNKQIITVSKRIIEEFFGNDGPKKFI